MYKLIINRQNIYEGYSLLTLIYTLNASVKPGDAVDFYRRARTTWTLEDGGIWGVKKADG